MPKTMINDGGRTARHPQGLTGERE
jgi:hypothetical protein